MKLVESYLEVHPEIGTPGLACYGVKMIAIKDDVYIDKGDIT